jgi:hypothetical protein
MAELILTGRTSIDVDALCLERFRTGKTIHEPMTTHEV